MIDKSNIESIKGIKGVYCLTSPSGKRYVGVGVGSDGIFDRWIKYLNLYNCVKSQPKLYNALKKHGPENFKYEIILETNDEDNAYRSEMYLIDVWKLQDDDYGYNIADGGIGGGLWTKDEKEERSILYKELFSNGIMKSNTENMVNWVKNNTETISNRIKKLWENNEYRKNQSKRSSEYFNNLWKSDDYKNKMKIIHKNASQDIKNKRKEALREWHIKNKDAHKNYLYMFLLNGVEVSNYSLEKLSIENNVSIHILRHLVSKKNYKPRGINIKFISKIRKES
jgi:hypothetical protein